MPGNNGRRGSQFERDTSRKLSLWWSDGQADDWFWRTGGSGGRATNRAKSGKSTENGTGDISAQNGEAQRLLSIVSIECKKGYQTYTIQDLLDKTNQVGGWWEFLQQSYRDASLAGVPYFLVIHKRDRREPIYVTNMPYFEFRIMVPEPYYSLAVIPESEFLSPSTRNILKALNA